MNTENENLAKRDNLHSIFVIFFLEHQLINVHSRFMILLKCFFSKKVQKLVGKGLCYISGFVPCHKFNVRGHLEYNV